MLKLTHSLFVLRPLKAARLVALTASVLMIGASAMAANAVVTISNASSGLCMDDPGFSQTPGTKVVAWGCNSGANQNFSVTINSDSTLTLVNNASNLCLEVSGSSVSSGAVIAQGSCQGGANQRFKVIAGSTSNQLVAANSNLCLDIINGSTQAGTGLQQYSCNGTPAQAFKLNVLSGSLAGVGTTTITASNARAAATWVQCAVENGTCSFTGTATVRYGAGSTYVSQTFTSGVSCSNATFGDPVPGVVKNCQISSAVVQNVAVPAMLAATASPRSGTTASGVALPSGWSLKQSDYFGTASGSSVSNMAQLHAKYYEGQFYNRDGNGRVSLPNVVINNEQQTYGHFENVIAFAADHITIQARGHGDNTISSGELVSGFTSRSFCVEAKYRIPNVAHAWPAFWAYGATAGNDTSELDFEQPISQYQGVHDVTLHNHPSEGTNLQIKAGGFTTSYMNFNNWNFDASNGAHTYTSCYNDSTAQIARYIDGAQIYVANYKWNQSLGGTSHGPDATHILNLAVGGDWPGYVSSPSSFAADMDIYSVDYYAP